LQLTSGFLAPVEADPICLAGKKKPKKQIQKHIPRASAEIRDRGNLIFGYRRVNQFISGDCHQKAMLFIKSRQERLVYRHLQEVWIVSNNGLPKKVGVA
jgi:hypothetical protein